MNPGYLSLLLMLVTLILFASGWKDFMIRGITNTLILLFFIFWCIGMKLSVAIPYGHIQLNVLVLCAVIVRALWRSHGHLYRLHLLSIGILLGSVTFFMLETLHLMPFLVIGNQEMTIALVIAVLLSFMTRNAGVQIAVASLGLLLGDAYYRYLHRAHAGFQLGTLGFQDLWWLTICLTRGISLVLAGVLSACKKSALWLIEGIHRRSGDRE